MKHFVVDGTIASVPKMTHRKTRLMVGVINDMISRSLIITEEKNGTQMQIPITDEIIKALTRG